MKTIFFIFCLFYVSGLTEIFGQSLPQCPNKMNKKGRQGAWIITYNKAWKETNLRDSVAYYRLLAYQDDKPAGKVKDYYLSGKVQWEGTLLADRPEEIKDGLCIWYLENGNIQQKSSFVKGKQEGLHQEYHPNGKLSYENNYSDGKSEGVYKSFYENGVLEEKGTHKQGKLDGYIEIYNRDATLKRTVYYKAGLRHGIEMYYVGGNVDKARKYKEDIRIGGLEDMVYIIRKITKINADSCFVWVNSYEEEELFVGSKGVIYSTIKNPVEKHTGNELGEGTVVSIKGKEAKIKARINKAKYIYKDDVILLRAFANPPTYRSILYDLAIADIVFLDNSRVPCYKPQEILKINNDSSFKALEKEVIDLMITTIKEIPEDFVKGMKVPTGKYAGQSLYTAMQQVTPSSLRVFLIFAKSYRASYMGTDWKISETYATWILNKTPVDLKEMTSFSENEKAIIEFAQDNLVNSTKLEGELEKNKSESEKQKIKLQLSEAERAKNLLEIKEREAREIQLKEAIINAKTKAEKDSLQVLQISNTEALEKAKMREKIAKQDEEKLLQNAETQRLQQNLTLLVGSTVVGALLIVVVLILLSARRQQKAKNEIEKQKQKSDALLLNILPADVANELKEKGITEVRQFDNASILFADVKGFSALASRVTPKKLIAELDATFTKMDEIILKHGLERIKTIGDCYMAVGGVPHPSSANTVEMVLASLEIQKWMNDERQARNGDFWQVRLGLHTGELVAGVIGKTKFAYDVWGNSVNLASRMESGGEVGKVNTTEYTKNLINDFFDFTYRGELEAKNIGKVNAYFIDRIKPELSADTAGFVPNERFYQLKKERFGA